MQVQLEVRRKALRYADGGDVDTGWRSGPFYWPVTSAQQNTLTSIFAHEMLGPD